MVERFVSILCYVLVQLFFWDYQALIQTLHIYPIERLMTYVTDTNNDTWRQYVCVTGRQQDGVLALVPGDSGATHLQRVELRRPPNHSPSTSIPHGYDVIPRRRSPHETSPSET